jgi:hypothetical protein
MLAALTASTLLAVVPARAADEAPPFEKGPVWDFTQVKTVDGHFDDYMKFVTTVWKDQEETLKKAGRIIDYKVFLVANARQGEPDIILAQEYKNMAGFDRPVADEYAMAAQISGPLAKANQEQTARSSIRTIQGDMMMREITLK